MSYHFSAFLPFRVTDSFLDISSDSNRIWVLRGEYFMAGYDPVAKCIRWYYQLKQDNMYEGRRMFRQGDFLITSYLNDGKSGQAWLLAFRPENGEVIWNHKANPNCMNNHGDGNYFYQTEHYIMYPDSARKVTVVLDAETGEEAGTLPIFRYSNAFRAGNYTYVWYQKTLLRIPWGVKELPESWEEVPLEYYLTDVVVQEDRVLLISATNEDDSKVLVVYMDAHSWEEKSRLVVDWPTRYKPTVISGPQPGSLLLQLDERVASLDLEVPVIHWDQEWEDDPELLWTDHGICAKEGFDTTFMMDPVSGERLERRLNLEYRAKAWKDTLLTDGKSYQIPYFLEEGTEDHKEILDTIGAKVEKANPNYYLGYTFVMQWKEGPALPPDESMVVDLPGSDSDRIGNLLAQLKYEVPRKEKLWKQLEVAFEKFKEDKDVEAFSASLIAVTGIKQVHPDIKEYFVDGLERKKTKGYKKSLEHLSSVRSHFLTYDHLIGMGPDDELFPGIYGVGYTTSGIEYILMLEEGWVLDIHHDSLSEYAWDYEDEMEKDPLLFSRKFGSAYGKGPLGKWRSKKKK